MSDSSSAASPAGWLPLVYDCVHRLAERALARERAAHSLQPTLLVHEAWLRLSAGADQEIDRPRFMAVAARVIREVLVDHARGRNAQKRGASWSRITLSSPALAGDDRGLDLLALEDALRALAAEHERAARVVEVRFFGGLTVAEVARELEVSTRTVELDWRFARAWLAEALGDDGAS